MKKDVSNRFTLNESQALKACFEDTIYFQNMLLNILKTPECGLLINGFISEVSMFVVESYDCLIRITPEVKELLNPDSIEALRPLRHRAKILEYTKDINLALNDLSIIDSEQKALFQSYHTGLLSNLKRYIQPDLGMTKYREHFITTTHSTLFDMAPNISSSKLESDYIFALGESIGIYLDDICKIFDIQDIEVSNTYASALNDYQMVDIKSERLFKRSSFSCSNKKFAPALILMLVRLNYTKFITTQFFPRDSNTLLRTKFLNIYHVCKSLNKIQSLAMKNNPSDVEKFFFKEILSNVEARWLIKQSSLRNLYVHYLLDKKKIERLSDEFTREEAVQVLSGGLSPQDIDKKLDVLLDIFTKEIEGFFELTDRTFWTNRV